MRKLVLVGLFLVAGLAFAATPGKILIWADDTRAPVFREIGKTYTEKTGIPVEVVEIPFGQIRDQFVTAAPTGEGPDIIIGAHDWVGELAASGLLAEILLPEELKAKFDAVSLEAFTYGKLYGLPYAREGVGLLYNKSSFLKFLPLSRSSSSLRGSSRIPRCPSTALWCRTPILTTSSRSSLLWADTSSAMIRKGS
jgi:ABC-type glycerol-3-phosphate transport system substrate-binding protein